MQKRTFKTFNLLGLEDFEMKIDQIALKENGETSNEIKSNKRSADDDWITNLYHQFNHPLSSNGDLDANEVLGDNNSQFG